MLSDGVRPVLTPLKPFVLILRTNTNQLREDVFLFGPIVLILRTNKIPLKEDEPPLGPIVLIRRTNGHPLKDEIPLDPRVSTLSSPLYRFCVQTKSG